MSTNEYFVTMKSNILKKFIEKITLAKTEATLYGPNGELNAIMTPERFKKWEMFGMVKLEDKSMLINNDTKEFIIFEKGNWKYPVSNKRGDKHAKNNFPKRKKG